MLNKSQMKLEQRGKGRVLSASTSGSKTAPLYTGFAVVLLFRSCLLLWISGGRKMFELEERYGEPQKLNFIVLTVGFLMTN